MPEPRNISSSANILGSLMLEHERNLVPFALAAAGNFRDAAVEILKVWDETCPEAMARIEKGREGIQVTIYMPLVLGRISLTEGMMPPGASPKQIEARFPGIYREAAALVAAANRVASLLEDEGRTQLLEIMLEAAEEKEPSATYGAEMEGP